MGFQHQGTMGPGGMPGGMPPNPYAGAPPMNPYAQPPAYGAANPMWDPLKQQVQHAGMNPYP